MSSIVDKLRGFSRPYLTVEELKHYLDGSDDSFYSSLKRGVANGQLIRIRRGLYCLSDQLTWKKAHPYELARRVCDPSIISLESALSYHGLIPEAVYTVTSVTPHRKNYFSTPLGDFSYSTVPKKNFMVLVERITEGDSIFFMATPWRAITDYVYCHKKDWVSLQPLLESLRIELEDLPELTGLYAKMLKGYYRSKRIDKFINGLLKEFNDGN